jgi:phenylpropionate dioxygenase-like ring-hydroxylating dioxygenase large terminal subunit
MTINSPVSSGVALEKSGGSDWLVRKDPSGSVFEISHRVYTDDEVYQRELREIFGRQWVFVGLELEIPEPGDYKTTWLGEVPVIVLRDNDGKIRVYENVCLHRGAKLLKKPCGKAKAMTCVYHRWSFGLDGRLLGVGLPDGYPDDFKKEDYNLSETRVETYCGMIFASYNTDIQPLADYLGDFRAVADELLNHGQLVFTGFQRYHVKANWKLFVENTIDAYHPGMLHVAIMRDRSGVKWTDVTGTNTKFPNGHTESRWPLTVLDPKDWNPRTDLPLTLGKGRQKGWNRVTSIFPNVMLLQIEDILTIRQLIPRGRGEVDVICYNFALEGESEEAIKHRAWVTSGQFGIAGVASLDDKIVMESVQETAKARYESTVLLRGDRDLTVGAPTSETGLRGFYEMWASCLAEGNQ